MCGIFAIYGKTVDDNVLEKAFESLSQRGPDDRGIMHFTNCTLAQTRLAIVDLSPGGHQPKKDNTSGIAITFNGEIYNYKELRKKLEAKGHHFSSESDTETILKAYLEYGEEYPKHLDGMFALVIWDENKQKLFFARDRFGKKPLYYAHDSDGRLIFASEIKALKSFGIIPEIDPAAVDAYLALMYVPPWRTFFKNVFTVLPAHSGYVENNTVQSTSYWSLEKKEMPHISYDDAKEKVRTLFDAAVKKRMIADVEIGSFLSGGVDSTLITAYAQRCATHPLKTFSLGYGTYINELPFADEAAKTIQTDHRTLQADGNLLPELEKVMSYMDEPHADSANLAQHLLSEFTAQHVKVALAGDGGDELFMGYGWYWAYFNRPKVVALKNALFSNQFAEHIKSITVFPLKVRKLFMKESLQLAPSYVSDSVAAIKKNDAEKINAYDFASYLPGQLLTKVDRTSMMHSLEVRCPLLDHELAEFVYNLPMEYKMNETTGKFILKDLLAEVMPRAFVDRKKQGFGAPVRKWLNEEKTSAEVLAIFRGEAHLYTLLKREHVLPFVERTFSRGNQKSYYQVWVLLCLELWLRTHHN